jgi:hypothetical protein
MVPLACLIILTALGTSESFGTLKSLLQRRHLILLSAAVLSSSQLLPHFGH